MEKVLGMGGLFFRANDPAALGRWYLEHLGISLVPSNYDDSPWYQEAGPTAFAPFEKSTDYFGNSQKQWMVNFRVRDLVQSLGSFARVRFRSRSTHKVIRTVGSLVFTIQKGIPWNYGNQSDEMR